MPCPADNDRGGKAFSYASRWYQWGLHRLYAHEVVPGDSCATTVGDKTVVLLEQRLHSRCRGLPYVASMLWLFLSVPMATVVVSM